jgi:glycerophosphoryl diester phosphodiesterase
MPHRLFQVAKPLVIAHRGASLYAPENTMAAFRLALEQKADGIELDAKLTTDGKVVVIHDQTVNRTTGAHGVVRKMSLPQLKALDAGSHFSTAFAGERIPTLEEVFLEIGSRALINVEITNYTSVWDALPDRIADLVIQYNLQEHVFFSSFHPLNLARIRRRIPGAPAALLTMQGGAGKLLRGRMGLLFSPQLLHPYFTDVTSALLAREHAVGRRVNVWTVNQPEEMRRLFNIGIDGIITDDSLLARQVMEEK